YASILDEAENEGQPALEVVQGRAALLDPHTVEVTFSTGSSRRLIGDQVLIATGSSPVIPDVPGLSKTPYLTSDLLTSQEDWELKALPSSLVILGGGYIALELGQMFARFGTEVTILERWERILKDYEPEISLALTDVLREEGLRIVTSTTLQQVEGDANQVQVTAAVRGQQRHFQAEKLLVATSRQPNTRNIGLERAGVELDAQGAVRVNAYLRTNVPHIWAAGDVIGSETESQMATPVGAHDGGIAASNALAGTNRRVNHTVIPRTIFTDPQVAVVGLTDEEANARGIVCECNTIPLSTVPRAGAIRDTRGVIKMVLEHESRRVVGVSMLGVNAGEVIHEA